jgi:hypothetical protein
VAYVADQLIWRLARSTGQLAFDELAFARLFEEYQDDLQRTSCHYVVLMPLLGLIAGGESLELAPDLEISPMTDAEIAMCLRFGFLPDHMAGLQRMRQITSEFAVRLRYDVAKRVGGEPGIEGVDASATQTRARDRCSAVVRALRVFKEGRVSIPGLVHFSDDWWVAGGYNYSFANPGLMPWFNKYELSPEERRRFGAFWPAFERVGLVGPLGIATRRFSDASERERPDDAVVDLVIAAESLFLSDTGEAQDRGELRYRLSLRAAFFIESPEYSKREVFRHMKLAYDARSAIAHGGEPERSLLKSPKGTELSLQEFGDITAKLVRLGLQKAVGMATSAGRLAVSWDELIIPD